MHYTQTVKRDMMVYIAK